MAGAATGLRTGFILNRSGFLKGVIAAKAELERRAEKAVKEGALLLKREIVKELSKKGTGRARKTRGRPKRGGVTATGRARFRTASSGNRASAPGEPPAVDFGRLRASIEEEVIKEFATWIGIVGTNLKVGREKKNLGVLLEFGTSEIEPRPFFRPALARIRPQLVAIFARNLAF